MRLLAILWISLKQVWYNRRLEVGLLVGLSVAVAVASSIPIYSSASLQKGLISEWEQNAQRAPYSIFINYRASQASTTPNFTDYVTADEYLEEKVVAKLKLEPEFYSTTGTLGKHKVVPSDSNLAPPKDPWLDIWYISNLRELTTLIDGRWPERNDQERYFEVVVEERAFEELEFLIGNEYSYLIDGPKGEPNDIYLKIVGVIRANPETYNSSYWSRMPTVANVFFVNEDDFKDKITENLSIHPANLDWLWLFDHRKVYVHELDSHIEALNNIQTDLSRILPSTRYTASPLNIMNKYMQKARTTNLFLLALSFPILGMIFYYVALTAGLAVSNRTNEIAMLRSRGASGFQILFSFFIEWSVLGVIALAIGPYLGLLISKVMGAAAGFLSFVGRTPIPVKIIPDAYKYGAAAVATALIAAILPTIPAMRHSIVTYKSQLAQKPRTTLWHKMFLDVILLGLTYLGYRQLARETGSISALANLGTVPIDPSLFLLPFIFTLGGGILGLRLFPWFMSLLSWVTGRWSGLSWSLTTKQMARNPMQYSALLLLLMVTVSMGIYSASAARTLEQNHIDRIMYNSGADVVITEQWVVQNTSDPNEQKTESTAMEEVLVYEPPFYIHYDLTGVKATARVLQRQVSIRVGSTNRGYGQLMAIDPHEFAATAWDRQGLLPIHRNHYLNALIKHHEGVLIQKGLMEELQLKPGDWINLLINNQPVDMYIIGEIEFWTGLDPTKAPILVANLDHIQQQTVLEPYDVWLDLEEGAQLQVIVDELRSQGIYVTDVSDSRRFLIEARRDPLRMGFFGILTIGFLVSLVVTLIGFFLFHLLSLRNRALQFGVLRAMGLSMKQLVTCLGLEGLFTVGAGIGMGSALGIIAANRFLPFLQLGGELSSTIPPFIVVIQPADLSRIYNILLSMLVLGIIVLASVLAKIKLHQAVKLGEEA
jgi:putative ABC transport system permease protein